MHQRRDLESIMEKIYDIREIFMIYMIKGLQTYFNSHKSPLYINHPSPELYNSGPIPIVPQFLF